MFCSEYNKYNIISELGKGAFGKVYKVFNDLEKKYYVIKEISLNGLNNEMIQQMKNEANFLSQFISEYIVKYKESFEDNNKNTFNIVMEYCRKGDLRQFINKYKKLGKIINEDVIYSIILDICNGIKAIHNKNIIHRDLKPENIFIDDDYNIKIGDLGISKQLSENTLYAQTFAGTRNYMAPEIFNNDIYNNKVDIWALGCIIYELFTLNFCFKGPNLVTKIIGGKYERIIYQNNIFSDWQNIIDIILKINPDERPDIDNLIKLIKKFEEKEHIDEISSNILKKNDKANNIIKIVVQKKFSDKLDDKININFINQNYFYEHNIYRYEIFVNRKYYGTETHIDFSKYKNNFVYIEIHFLDPISHSHCKSLFKNCKNIIEVDLSGFKWDNKILMSFEEMFFGCENLEKINFSNFDLNVINMKSTFENCINLKKIDFSGLCTAFVTTMERMFYNCKNLIEIGGLRFDIELANSSEMFYGCRNLDLNYDYLEIHEYVFSMFNTCTNLKTINLYCCSGSFPLEPEENKDMSFMFANCENLESVYLDGFTGKKMNSMFYGCKKLKKVELILERDIEGKYYECESLEEMYSNCKSLEIAYLYPIKKGCNINNIFYNCSNLLCVVITIDNINDIKIPETFKYCNKLKLVYVLETIKESDIKKEFEKINIFPKICACKTFDYDMFIKNREYILDTCKDKK